MEVWCYTVAIIDDNKDRERELRVTTILCGDHHKKASAGYNFPF